MHRRDRSRAATARDRAARPARGPDAERARKCDRSARSGGRCRLCSTQSEIYGRRVPTLFPRASAGGAAEPRRHERTRARRGRDARHPGHRTFAAARRGAGRIRPSRFDNASTATRRAGCDGRRRRHHPVDVGQHVTTEIGALDPRQHLSFGTQRGRCLGARRAGSPAQLPAAFPCSRPDLRTDGRVGCRIRRSLHAGARSRRLLRLADRVSTDLVHRGPLVSPGHSFCGRSVEARPRAVIAATRPLRLGNVARRGTEQAGSAVRRAGHRDLWHDGRQLADRIESVGLAQARLGRPRHRARDCDHRRRRANYGARPAGRNRAAGPDHHAGI